MEYTSLYRKFRPLTFNEIVGQEHIVKTLKNEIIAGRVGHAYLFNGGRGTGKTSAAKILARAINCLNSKEGEPCNECAVCKAALEGSLTDIVEMDAASNNSVDNIRSICEEVNFLPTLAQYRIYIIDEVHMLSIGAFNALLKTLEEPPAHVKFILATTEPQKLPATILSRCQRFDFKKISNENIEKRLNYVCEKSNINITKEAIKTIAILAEGAMRDALSILERCMQENNEITEEIVKELVGIPPISSINSVCENIIKKNTEGAINAISENLNNGKDTENFLWEIIKYIKDILMFKSKINLEIYSEEEIEKIEELSKITTKERLLEIIFALSELANKIKWSSQKNIMLQVEIIKLCNIDESNNAKPKKEVNDKIEKDINNSSKNVDNKIKKLEKTTNKTDIKKIEVGEKIKNWPGIVNNIKQSGKMSVYSYLASSAANQINDMTIGISFPKGLSPIGKAILEQTENMNEIVKQVSIELGEPMRVKLIMGDIVEKQKRDNLGSISKELDMPINIIDD